MEKYDVFISCKSEDYKYAEEVYDYLVDEGILTFLASKELRKVGESEYRKAISKALKESSHIIVFASQAEYIESDWVEFEWDMFLNAKLKGKKQGNIITVLKEVDTDDIPMELWKYESFPFNDFKSKILKYVETEESKERRKEIQRKREAERLRSEEEKKKEAKRNELKSDLIWTAENYKRSLSSLQVDIDKIYRILHELGISQRECPICKNHITLEESYCSECGWPISPLDGIEELAYLNNNEDIRKIFQKHYQENDAKKLRDFEDLQTAYETLKNKFQALQEENDKSKRISQNLEIDLSISEAKKINAEKELANVRRELEQAKNKNSELEKKSLFDSEIPYLSSDSLYLLAKSLGKHNPEIAKMILKEARNKGCNKERISYLEGNGNNNSNQNITHNYSSSSSNTADYTTILRNIKLKRVSFPEGDFLITCEELPAAKLCKEFRMANSQENSSNKRNLKEFKEILNILKVKTGYTWDFPTIKEWSAAYNGKVFVNKNDYIQEWCVDHRRAWCFISKPSNSDYVSNTNYSYLLHPVIRLKDNNLR